MADKKGSIPFDREIQDAWRDGSRLDRTSDILNSLSALGEVTPPSGLKQKLIEIPEQSSAKIFWLSPMRAGSLILAPALALLFVLVVIPKQKHSETQVPPKPNTQFEQPQNSDDQDSVVEDLGSLTTDIGDDADSNILDQDLQDLEEVL
jgi:hypothetical protein